MSQQDVTLNGHNIPIKSVTVYTDRAEIIRNFTVPIKSGFTEVRIENLPGSIHKESVRVDGTGHNVTIHEVRFETKPVKPEDYDTPRIRELVAQQKELQITVDDARSLKTVYEAQIEALNKALSTLGQNAANGKDNNFVSFNEDSVNSLHNFFNFQQQQTIDLKTKIRAQTQIVDDNTREVDRLQMEINQLRSNFNENNIVTVQLENTETEESTAEIELSYQVFNANWHPSYDIRVKSADKNHTLKLVYYGNIRQHTGEDWSDVDIVLSTATPGLGAALPTLGCTNVKFYEPEVIQHPPVFHQKGALFGTARAVTAGIDPPVPRLIKKKMVVQEESPVSTTFIIPIKKTIPSDHSEHKVIITTENLDALLNYHVVPKKNTNVFLFANVVNNSAYSLLPGPAIVYINNSMVATINMSAVFPGEQFKCSLGADKSIKVTYKPTSNYQSQSGILSKTNSTSNEQRIIVKNTKLHESILLTVHEPIPKATDEQIKVRLLSPEVKEATNNAEKKTDLKVPEVGATLDDLNNLEWTSVIAANQERELLIKWAVEYPPNKTLQYVEKFF